MHDEEPICFSESITAQSIHRYPFTGDMLTQLQPSAADLCPESEQVNTIIALLVANLAKKLTDLNVPIEFFPELPLKAMLQGFIGIDLPAGELPAQAELLMGWALGDEQPPICRNECGSDFIMG